MTQQEFYQRYSYSATEDLLGSGGFGKVFRAWDSKNDCEVALKIQPVNTQYPSLRLSQEVDTAAKLDHPNVARYKECYTFTEFGGETDIAVMSYYKDGSLDKLIKAQTLTYEQRVDILIQILEGIAYLHNHNLIHRDLKPQNILILHNQGRYIPKITDFGISKQLTDEESSVVTNSVLAGTRNYASPEQLMEKVIGKNTDLWSFGIIAFQMLTNSLPFNSGTFSPTSEEGRIEQYRQMQSGVLPDAIGRIAEPWQTLIRQCLVFDSKARIAHAEDCLSIVTVTIEIDGGDVDSDGDNEGGDSSDNKGGTPIRPSDNSAKKRSWWKTLLMILGVILIVILGIICGDSGDKGEKEKSPTEQLSAEELYYLAENHYDNDNYEEALKYLKRSAEKGYIEAQIELAEMYEDGDFGEEDYEMAAKWYLRAAEQGDSYAQWCVATLYEDGEGVPQSYTEAAKWYLKAAEQGDSLAQFDIACMYENGVGVTQNYSEATKWYRKAADQGNVVAQYNLGDLYYYGRGVPKSLTDAVSLYRKAAEQGYAKAQYKLGVCYYDGTGVSQNYTEAVGWFRKAADQGNDNAQYFMGCCYYFGNGVSQNYTEAVNWYRKAVDQGNASAQCNLGYCYENGHGVTQSYTEAVNLYIKAANQGDATAQHNLGYYYEKGIGVTQSYAEAVNLYRKAANQGNASSQCNLGYCYDKGIGVTQSYTEAVKWYLKAANQGNVTAQHNLGICYELGNGVTTNRDEAVKWYRKAAQQGYGNAQNALTRLGETW